MHLENFGTWRDAEGRLVWGVNDFDEAAVMPYAFDLLRLATSVRLAPEMAISIRDAAAAIIAGYRAGFAQPRPTFLDEQETWMRPLGRPSDDERRKFWQEIDALSEATPSPAAVKVLKGSLPRAASKLRFAARRKGAGGLGRPRYVVSAEWRGGRILREARALVPSAWDWAHGASRSADLDFSILRPAATARPIRRWRFGTNSSSAGLRRIRARSIWAAARDGGSRPRLLEAMGFDLGRFTRPTNRRSRRSFRDLNSRPADWLREATKAAVVAVTKDFEAWKANVMYTMSSRNGLRREKSGARI